MVDIDIVYVVAWRAIVVELKVEEVFNRHLLMKYGNIVLSCVRLCSVSIRKSQIFSLLEVLHDKYKLNLMYLDVCFYLLFLKF